MAMVNVLKCCVVYFVAMVAASCASAADRDLLSDEEVHRFFEESDDLNGADYYQLITVSPSPQTGVYIADNRSWRYEVHETGFGTLIEPGDAGEARYYWCIECTVFEPPDPDDPDYASYLANRSSGEN